MNFVNLVIDNNNRNTDRYYTYKTQMNLKVGDIVLVSFAKGGKLKKGFVVEVGVEPDIDKSLIKEIDTKFEEYSLTKEAVSTAIWMKSRYGIRFIEALKLFTPSGDAPKRKEKISEEVVEPTKWSIEFTKEQEHAIEQIEASMKEGQRHFLIHGVTGSGKTEIFINEILKSLENGKQVLYLVPEISMIDQSYNRLVKVFGSDNIVILHSKLTRIQQYRNWMKVANGSCKIVLGTRMSTFAPFNNLGTIIIDEEHEGTYKADMTPKYDAIDISYKRAINHGAQLILASATPSLVSYYRSQKGIYKLIQLKERYNLTPLPMVEIVDMAEELKMGNRGIFSNRLYSQLKETLDRGKQAILFVNRRGYASSIGCRDCGYVMECPECKISLTYHKGINKGVCHYCGKTQEVIESCPKCGGNSIRQYGFGTEQVEEQARLLFPEHKVVRLDTDTGTNLKEIKAILRSFKDGESKILVGTQLVAKSLDFKNVHVVGVVSADVSLNIADYRAAERGFQLITQVAGRAGRGEEQGKVIIQTLNPDNSVIIHGSNQDFEGFFKEEIRVREFMDYPPFTDLIEISLTGKNQGTILKKLNLFRNYLIESLNLPKNLVLDVHEDFYFKGEGSIRYLFVVKAHREVRKKIVYLGDSYSKALAKERDNLSLLIDVNPY